MPSACLLVGYENCQDKEATPFALLPYLSGKVEGEHLYNALGRTNSGRYLSIFFIEKLNNKALIVTARDMNNNEKKKYEKK